MARSDKTPSGVDFGMGPRGDIPNPQGSEYCVSPLESRTPNPEPLGIKGGLGAQPPDCRLGRQLCRLPAITTCRGGPFKGPPLNKELYEKVRKVRKRFGGFGTEFRTLFHVCEITFRIRSQAARVGRRGADGQRREPLRRTGPVCGVGSQGQCPRRCRAGPAGVEGLAPARLSKRLTCQTF